ncbi:MAG TPA: hypothetical protein VJR27_01315 [Candidatus Saccharimonadales bacterium]|nr:hypothetical protein [Candidatus Saccharimonadales bacterium]
MIDEINQALEAYHVKWHELIAKRSDKAFFEALKPVAVGWKVAGRAEYERLYTELHDQCDQIIETWMNNRWIAKMHLRDSKLDGNLEIIKIMQRRPGSNDAIGLDHLDFYGPTVDKKGEAILKAEPGLKWSRESNDLISGYEWLSLWFDGAETKLRSSTVLDVIGAELTELSQKIKM